MIYDCPLCQESKLNIGDKTNYGARVIYKIWDYKTGWFATLSPKTGGDCNRDFTIQLMPLQHLIHMSEISENIDLAKNYGIAFSQISRAIKKIMEIEGRHNENEEGVIRIGTYGKSKHLDEHFHVKLFPWSGNIGQPYTVDTTFEKSKIYLDENGKEFVKLNPVRKVRIDESRLDDLSNKFISLLK
ncbi:hypothetical protein J4477_02255 [Candidatus Pacearchaeota archaeon]|nr:hypothetical protein [Candidatus Pacearchaeota archaeon]